MPNDLRHTVLVNFLQTRYSHSPERAREWAESVLPLIDSMDPLRQPPSDEAVDVAFSSWFVGNPPNSSILRNDMRRALIAALAVMRGEAIDRAATAPGHTDLMASPEANPPQDVIEDRLATLEAGPQFTAEKEALLRALAEEWTADKCIADKRLALYQRAFNQPERVWPPVGCLAPDLGHCAFRGRCVRPTCPHAGERA